MGDFRITADQGVLNAVTSPDSTSFGPQNPQDVLENLFQSPYDTPTLTNSSGGITDWQIGLIALGATIGLIAVIALLSYGVYLDITNSPSSDKAANNNSSNAVDNLNYGFHDVGDEELEKLVQQVSTNGGQQSAGDYGTVESTVPIVTTTTATTTTSVTTAQNTNTTTTTDHTETWSDLEENRPFSNNIKLIVNTGEGQKGEQFNDPNVKPNDNNIASSAPLGDLNGAQFGTDTLDQRKDLDGAVDGYYV